MKRLLDIIASIAIVFVAAALVYSLVIQPALANRALRVAMESTDAQTLMPSRARGNIEILSGGPWDSYFEGKRRLYLARNLRAVGAEDAAVAAYRRSLAYAPDMEVLLELGTYELQVGRQEEGEIHLAIAIAYSYGLRAAIPYGPLRERAEQRAAEWSREALSQPGEQPGFLEAMNW
ncbi:MAG: hypothetical protein KY459_14125 [Acidobacteria bacterium]|nr:hypothetical protein [Acidobacteriota bacterium]